ncbi:NUDIX hydrolase [uncultured Algibacter sp.]|mgnify:FL=1|jgi:8-oxo-dGTP diphosphatase|uniref:NUDIX hydrolase n=1 Tax=uncultured Algibacter sp. TaxID=298659 RepID=UPI0025ED2B0A|nr:NUDIX hydrolase [uncultured Algibacter sp.]
MFSKIDKSRLIAIKNDKILVLEKIGEKKKYSLAGGVKKKKETDIQSLIRETFEEIGLKLKKKELTYFLSRKNNNTKKKEIYKHYFITNTSIKNIEVLEPHKFKKVLWVSWYDALEYLDKDDRSAITLYFDQFRKQVN